MPRARDPNFPQHNIDQAHWGEFPLELLPDGTDAGDAIVWDGAAWVIQPASGGDGDGKVLVSATDLVRDFLESKVQAGENINIEITGSGADEKLVISASAASGEVLMVDGISDPPEPMTNEDGTDWLYEG